MTAAELLRASADRYAGCRTYRDRGRLTRRYTSAGGTDRMSVTTFTVAVVRPDRLRLERVRAGPDPRRFLTHSTGGRHQSWAASSGGSAVGDLRTHLLVLPGAGVTGELLRGVLTQAWDPPARDLPFDRLAEPTVVPDADLDGMSGRRPDRPGAGPFTVWLDAATLLVRRLEYRLDFGPVVVDLSADFDPTLDGPVPDADLRFDPPAGRWNPERK